MIRVLEVLVSLLIVFLLAVLIAVFLPDHGHVERSVTVSSPLRQVYDSVTTFRRFPQWSAVRRNDPALQINFAGAESGPGAKVEWTSAKPEIGSGNMEIVSAEQDSEVRMALDNPWSGTNKSYTITLEPSSNGKTVKITWAYDTDYGWNLVWRYAGLYIHGDPATTIQVSLNNIAAMLSTFPNVDYSEQPIEITDVPAQPILFVSTKAPRTLDEVEIATDAALAQIEEVMAKAGLTAVGPRRTITTNWGDEDYVFDVAVPVSSASFAIGDQTFTITESMDASSMDDSTADEAGGESDDESDPDAPPAALEPGDRDPHGNLVIEGNVKAVMSYQGKALVTEYTGSAAALPLLRLMEKAYAETHGYPFSEMADGRMWDEMTTPVESSADVEDSFRVYLPVQL
jgi:uncharacterized protein YndB with AHSA1/START domain